MSQLPIHTSSKMSKLKYGLNLSADKLHRMNTIILGMCGALQGAFYECKTPSYVAIVSKINHSLKRV